MILLTSLIYCFLMYVLPGVLLIDFGAGLIGKQLGLPPELFFFPANLLIYLIILFIVKKSHLIYKDLDLDQNKQVKAVKEFLRGGDSSWLGAFGVLILGAGSGIMFILQMLPFQVLPLVAAASLGYWSKGANALHLSGYNWLPEPRDKTAIEPPADTDCLLKELSWSFFVDGSEERAENFTEQFALGQMAYETTRSLQRFPRSPLTQYLRYITEQRLNDIKAVANQLRFISIGKGFTPIQEAENIVALVRSIPYVSDEETHNVDDYANYPIETLVELAGDCEDHGILAASLLFELGHKVGLYWLSFDDCGHIALAYHTPEITAGFGDYGKDGKWYHYVETVPCNASERIGDLSRQFKKNLKKAKVLAIT